MRMAEIKDDNDQKPPYLYPQLINKEERKEIRLLEVLPDDQKSHLIICRLRSYATSELPAYEALSYTWGSGVNERCIIIKTDDGLRRLDITENLYSALWRLRHESKSRLLWADAVCINQEDMVERSSQVQIMRDIYSRSAGALIWLGEKSRRSEEALELVHTIHKVKAEDEMKGVSRQLIPPVPQDNALPSEYSPIWHHFCDVLRRPWFQRAWIVQELAVAPQATIFCGSQQVTWAQFYSAYRYLLEISGSGLWAVTITLGEFQALTNLEQIRQRYQKGERFTIFELLILNGQVLATDKRDHIFAFHGLLPPSSRDSLMTKPKYTAQLPNTQVHSPNYLPECIELYTETARLLLDSERNLDLLSVTSVTRKSAIKGLPTWVPDWSAPMEEYFLYRHFFSKFSSQFNVDQRPNYRASGYSSCVLSYRGRELLLRGYVVDTVRRVSIVNNPMSSVSPGQGPWFIFSQVHKDIEFERAIQSFESTAGFWTGFQEKYPTGEDLPSAYWQTLVGGLEGLVTPAIARANMMTAKQGVASPSPLDNDMNLEDCRTVQDRARSKEYKLMKRCFSSWQDRRLLGRIPAWLHLDWPPLILLYYIYQMFQALLIHIYDLVVYGWYSANPYHAFARSFHSSASRTVNRRLVRTEQGLIGLAPPLTGPGDTIVLCEGGKLPLILRRCDQKWELIGECYVHGLMDGAIWDELERRRKSKGGDMSSFWII